jgi:hypothetical protein
MAVSAKFTTNPCSALLPWPESGTIGACHGRRLRTRSPSSRGPAAGSAAAFAVHLARHGALVAGVAEPSNRTEVITMRIIIDVTDLTNVQEWITNVCRPYNGKVGGRGMTSRDGDGKCKSKVNIKSIMVEVSEREFLSLGSSVEVIRRSAPFCTLTIRED